MKEKLKKIPVLGEWVSTTARFLKMSGRKLRGKTYRGRDKYVFKRLELTHEPQNGMERSVQQISNILNYSKTSKEGQPAGTKDYPASVSMNINGFFIEGSRTPEHRLDFFPQDLTGKIVLDIGCNQGGMLFSIADKIKHGIGIDFDRTTINAANKIRSCTKRHNLDFYVFNLEDDDLNLIRDFIPADKVDVTFLLTVCGWIKNSAQVIELVSKISTTLFFETNGSEVDQQSQISSLRKCYKNVDFLHQIAAHKNGQEYIQRRLFFCH